MWKSSKSVSSNSNGSQNYETESLVQQVYSMKELDLAAVIGSPCMKTWFY